MGTLPEGLKVTFHGAKELDEALTQLPRSVAKSVLIKAMKNAGKPIADHARSLAPVDEGRLAESIDVRQTLTRRQRRGRSRRGAAAIFIGPTFPMGRHGHLVEFGTGPRYHKKTGKYVGMMSARPFLRPAWDSGRSRALDILRAEIWRELAAAARRLARKAEAGKISAQHRAELLG